MISSFTFSFGRRIGRNVAFVALFGGYLQSQAASYTTELHEAFQSLNVDDINYILASTTYVDELIIHCYHVLAAWRKSPWCQSTCDAVCWVDRRMSYVINNSNTITCLRVSARCKQHKPNRVTSQISPLVGCCLFACRST
jgi:hypothetical protein